MLTLILRPGKAFIDTTIEDLVKLTACRDTAGPSKKVKTCSAAEGSGVTGVRSNATALEAIQVAMNDSYVVQERNSHPFHLTKNGHPSKWTAEMTFTRLRQDLKSGSFIRNAQTDGEPMINLPINQPKP
jgi:hypothetical protein